MQTVKKIFRYAQNNANNVFLFLFARDHGHTDQNVKKKFFRYAQNNAKNVNFLFFFAREPWHAGARIKTLKKKSFATRKKKQNIMFKGLLS